MFIILPGILKKAEINNPWVNFFKWRFYPHYGRYFYRRRFINKYALL